MKKINKILKIFSVFTSAIQCSFFQLPVLSNRIINFCSKFSFPSKMFFHGLKMSQSPSPPPSPPQPSFKKKNPFPNVWNDSWSWRLSYTFIVAALEWLMKLCPAAPTGYSLPSFPDLTRICDSALQHHGCYQHTGQILQTLWIHLFPPVKLQPGCVEFERHFTLWGRFS